MNLSTLIDTILILSTATTPFVLALSGFRDRIPNGRSVPNPDPQGGVWAGVGHENAGGGGPRNPFGLDFAAAGFEWTLELCQKDSDGDGRTNGQELGDPECMWSPGDTPSQPSLSHPGIVDEPQETPAKEPCANFTPPADLQAMEVKFTTPNSLMGEKRTEYICEQQAWSPPVPGTNVYHQLKTQVINNNPEVLHHIWVYACDGVDSSDGARVDQGAYSCNGVEANCLIVAGWAVGGNDFCEPPNVGARVEWFGSTKVFKIEAHYDNALLTQQTDQSGIRLHLTPTLRQLDSNLVVLGMDYWDRQFEIPPQQEEFSLTNICPVEATSRLTQPIFAYAWNPHMHFVGTSVVTEHYRCGVKIGELGRIDSFEFDNQQTYLFREPIKILPGDVLVTTCTYNSSNQMERVLGGEETTEEMCDNYLTYYPYVGTSQEPNLFTACSSFLQGLNPAFAANGVDDRTPFVTLDLGGDSFLSEFSTAPTMNLPSCCNSADGNAQACEEQYKGDNLAVCAANEDCQSELLCADGLCQMNDNSDVIPSPDDEEPTQSPTATSDSPAVSTIGALTTSSLMVILWIGSH